MSSLGGPRCLDGLGVGFESGAVTDEVLCYAGSQSFESVEGDDVS